MVGMGSWLGIAMDTYQRLFKRTERRIWLIFIYDILFWIVQSIFIFYVLYLVNHGEVRFYIFLALLCGFSAYQSLLKNFYTYILERLIFFLKKLFRFLKKLVTIILVKPLLLLMTGLFSLLLWISKGLLFVTSFIVKLFFSPFLLFGKFLWNFVPESIRIKVTALMKTIRKISMKLWQLIMIKK